MVVLLLPPKKVETLACKNHRGKTKKAELLELSLLPCNKLVIKLLCLQQNKKPNACCLLKDNKHIWFLSFSVIWVSLIGQWREYFQAYWRRRNWSGGWYFLVLSCCSVSSFIMGDVSLEQIKNENIDLFCTHTYTYMTQVEYFSLVKQPHKYKIKSGWRF